MPRRILLLAILLLNWLFPSFVATSQTLPDGSQLSSAEQLAIATQCKANEAVASNDQSKIDEALSCVQAAAEQLSKAKQQKVAQLKSLLGSALQQPAGAGAPPLRPVQQAAVQQPPESHDLPQAASANLLKITTYGGSGFYLDLATVIKGANVPTCPCSFDASDDIPPGLQFATSLGNEPIVFGKPAAGDKTSYAIKQVTITGVDSSLAVPMTIDVVKNAPQPVKIGGTKPVPLAVSGFNGEPYSASFTLKDTAGKACPSIVVVGAQTVNDLKSTQQLTLDVKGGTGTLTAGSLAITSPISIPVACTAGGQTATVSVAPYQTAGAPAVAAATPPHAKMMFAPLTMPIVEGASEIKGQVLNIPAGVLPLSAQLWITAPGARTPALVTLKSGTTSSALAADGTYDLQLSSPLSGGSTVLIQLVTSAGVTLPVDDGKIKDQEAISPSIQLGDSPKLTLTSEVVAAASTITGTVTMPVLAIPSTATPAFTGNFPQITVWTTNPITKKWSVAQLTTASGTATFVPVSDAYGNFSVTLKNPLTAGQQVRVLAVPPPGRTFANDGLGVPPLPPSEVGNYSLATQDVTVIAPLQLVKPTLASPAPLIERAATLSGVATPPPTGGSMNVAVLKLDPVDTQLNTCLYADNLSMPGMQGHLLQLTGGAYLAATTATTGAYSVTLAAPLNRTDRIQIVQVLPAGTVLPDSQSNKCSSDVVTAQDPYTWASHDGTQVGNDKYTSPCTYNFNDCDFKFSLVGGVEQADLSAQSSVTQGFYYLFIRSPYNMHWGNLWFISRYLGAPNSSSTQNLVAAAASPSTTITASSLPQSVDSIDYRLGVEHDFFLPNENNKGSGQWTIGTILSFGATSPLSSNSAVSGFKVPDFGTNECNQIQQRFGSKFGYNPALPSSGYYNTAAAGVTPVASTTQGCVVQPQPSYASGTTANPGTQITTVAFSNEDRSSFLLKYDFGLRFIHRTLASGATHCSPYGSGDDPTGGLCRRLITDLTFGQDQAITGGYLRRFVFKADTVIPVLNTGAYFFASSATRIARNTTFSPLILTGQTVGITNANSTCTVSATNVCLGSDNIFVLPFKQQNRDNYRIGIGIDLTTVLKLLSGATK